MPSTAAALLFGTTILVLGFVAGVAWSRLRSRDQLPLAVHRSELATLRRRYRHRLRTVRDAHRAHRASEEQLRGELHRAESHGSTEARLRAAAEVAAAELRSQLAAREAAADERSQALAMAQARTAALDNALGEARERIAALESQHGLMRIEREELVAHTQRLRTLDSASPPAGNPAATAGESRPGGRSARSARTELAARNARIHELECCLRESALRIDELESSLQTWKYRIAPLALHARQQEQARKERPVSIPAPRSSDDLKRIQGLDRVLERKMNDALAKLRVLPEIDDEIQRIILESLDH